MRDRPNLLIVVLAALVLWPAVAQAVAPGSGRGTTLVSPAGLGPRYTGYTGAGVGLVEKDPKYGVKAGDFVIQPRFFAELSYNSNFFRSSTRSVLLATDIEEGALITHLRPGVGIFNPKFNIVAVELTLDADIMLPIDVQDSVFDVFDQFNVGGTANARISFFPKGVLTFTIAERFRRELWRRSSDPLGNANRNDNSLGADLSFHPGGGAIDITAGYRWNMRFYDGLPELDRMSHDVRLLASWRFYPLTHVFLESTLNVSDYVSPPTAADGFNGNYLNGMPFRVFLGLSGYITERVALLARIGYGNSFLEDNPTSINFENPIGMLQATFRFTGSSALTVGGAYDFERQAFGGFRWFGRGYLSFAQRLGKIAQLHIDGAFDYRQYGEWQPYPGAGSTDLLSITESERSDMRVQAGLLVDFNIIRWFGVSVGYRLDMILADYAVRSQSGGVRFFDYTQHRVFLSLNLRY